MMEMVADELGIKGVRKYYFKTQCVTLVSAVFSVFNLLDLVLAHVNFCWIALSLQCDGA